MADTRQEVSSRPIGTKELRSYGLLMGGMISAIFGFILPWLFDGAYRQWPWITGAIFAVLALVAPRVLHPVYRLWMRFGHIMGAINTRIILFILFYIIITPIGFVMRISRDPMRRKTGKIQTYKIPSRARARNNMERPF